MLGQVIAAHKAALAFRTYELLFSRMRATMTGQFVGAGKFSFAAFPITGEGFLACVCPLVVEKNHLSRKTLPAHRTRKGSLPSVTALVYAESPLEAESLSAHLALEGLLASV